jgi:hypothetical protein
MKNGERPSPRAWALPEWVFLLALSLGAAIFLGIALLRNGEPPESSRVFISELGASLLSGIQDEDGDHSDWIEIANLGSEPVPLANWSLTDSFRSLTRWRFPEMTLAPGQRLIVFASAKDRRDPARPLHASFKLSDTGEYLALVKPDGRTIAQEFLPKYPPQRGLVSFGLSEGLVSLNGGIPAGAYTYFDQPTPGKANRGEINGLVAELKASEDGAICDSPLTLALSTRTTGARIFYTTNGTAPSEANGQLYRQPIRISSTTVLRAAAFQAGLAPTEILTRSFIFPEQVARQTGEGFPKFWGFTNGQPVAAFYPMDHRISDAPEYRKDLILGLKALPSLSIVTDQDNLFDPARGIYANPMESGPAWERPVSAEMIFPDGQRGFQIGCGLRIQGGWNRRPEESPKHSLRLVFKKEYGQARLHFPLFGREGVREFETLILRGGGNNSWLHWSGEERRRGDYLRDQWMRETSAAMGQPAARGRFVHLYLNGLYWGLYNLAERPSAPFLAGLQGAKPAHYDSRNSDKVLGGDEVAWNRLFEVANAGVTNAVAWQEIKGLLDVTNFADYMILNHYGANGDWDRTSNWYAGRRHDPAGGYQFFIWDGERTLEQVADDRMDVDDDFSPSRLFTRLKDNAEFRALYSERVRRHCTGDGPLTPLVAAERFRRLADALDLAIVAESGRWGSYRNDVHPYKEGPYERYTRNDHWRPEVQRLLKDYFPQRTEVFLKLLEKRGLRPPPDEAAKP